MLNKKLLLNFIIIIFFKKEVGSLHVFFFCIRSAHFLQTYFSKNKFFLFQKKIIYI